MSEYKRQLLIGQNVWTINKKDGKLNIYFGPHALMLTEDFVPVVQDPENLEKVKPVENQNAAIQEFCILKPDDYAVVHNPTVQYSEGYPNGSYKTGLAMEMPDLLYGQKRVIVSGYFPLWPYQRVEIRKVHELSTDQHLMAVVERVDVDRNAPFYGLLVRCADIKTAVVDDSVESVDVQDEKEPAKTKDIKEAADTPLETEEVIEDGVIRPPEDRCPGFVLGQRIVIPGSLTPTFIPPTGVELVMDDCADDNPDHNDSAPAVPTFDFDTFKNHLLGGAERGNYTLESVERVLREKGLVSSIRMIRKKYKDLLVDEYEECDALSQAIGVHLVAPVLTVGKADVPKPGKKPDKFIRQAVVLGPTDFCRIINEDGEPTNHKGPGRIFPGPYDKFETRGSDNRVYRAYHLRVDRGVLLRVIAERITKADLVKQLPEGSASQLEKERYFKGDEIFISEIDAYLVPSKSFEVIDPKTREPHLGNDHFGVFVEAIGVDQESGVYVASVDTGNVDTVQGEKKLLLDPRKRTHQRRKIPGDLWNLMIAEHEPHKKVSPNEMVESPWALSITIPNNEAALVTGGKNRRVVEGPCIELLGYRETLEVLQLSRGRPKKEDDVLCACFLRVTGNRVTDEITLTAADDQVIKVQVYYDLEFVAETDEDKLRWFDHKNYVWLLCSNLRSRLQAAARRLSIKELYEKTAEFVRDTILGVKGAGDEHRPGFCENSIRINEVDVLDIHVADAEIAGLLKTTNHDIVTQQLKDRAKHAELESKLRQFEVDKQLVELDGERVRLNTNSAVIAQQLKDEAEARLAELERERVNRNSQLTIAKLTTQHIESQEREALEHALAMTHTELQCALQAASHELAHALAIKQQADSIVLAEEKLAADGKTVDIMRNRLEADEDLALKLKKAALDAESEYKERERVVLANFRQALADAECKLIETQGSADAERTEALSDKLAAAIEGMTKSEMAAKLAESLPRAGGPMSLLFGTDLVGKFKSMAKGTMFEKGVNALMDTESEVEESCRLLAAPAEAAEASDLATEPTAEE